MDDALRSRAWCRSGRRALAVALAAVACLAVLWPGCSVEKNYRVLSFFFDGVPDPNAPVRRSAGGGLGAGPAQAAIVAVHKPYAEEKCASCHVSRFQLTVNDSALCLKCHGEKPTEYAVMHCPVAAGACLWCHTPHESAYASLLKAPARDVCSQCHVPGTLSTRRTPAHADAARSCLECHSGHGGTRPYFIREATAQPGRPGQPTPPPPTTSPPPSSTAPTTPSTSAAPTPTAEPAR